MPNWTSEQLRNYETRTGLQNTKPEPVVLHEPLGTIQGKEKGPTRVTVRIKSYRKRLLDPDNLAGGAKYAVDALRYARIISGDSPDKITLEVTQEKVKTKADERTEIEII